MAPKTVIRCASLVCGLALAGRAGAEPTPAQRTLADALFDEGRVLMAQNRAAEACPKFAESYSLDPSPGTLLNLGLCHEKEGKLASAYSELGESLSNAQRDRRPEREKLAREHLAAIEPRLSRLTVSVAAAAVDTPGLEVKLDGVVLNKPAWGVATPVDAGSHVASASAPGKRSWTETVTIAAERDARRVEVPVLPDEMQVAPPPPPPPRSDAVASPAVTPPPEQPGGGGGTQRTIGLIVGGAGVVGIGVGAVFAVVASGKWNDATTKCPDHTCKNADDASLGTSAGTMADVATAAFVIGGVALAAGAALFFTAPSGARANLRVAPLVARDGAGIAVGARL
jgi:hypothetical protein